MNILDARLDDLVWLAEISGYSLDDVVEAVGKCPESEFRAVLESPSILPRYIKSNVRPYLSHSL